MPKDKSFKVPDDIGKLVLDLHEKKARKNLENLKKKREESRARLNAIQKMAKAGLPYAKTIFAWTIQFRKSDTGQKLLDIGDSYIENGIFFFDTHIEGRPWCGLGISLWGVWRHASGCGARPVLVKTPQELAKAVFPEILKTAGHEIETGMVWETIRRRMKDNRHINYLLSVD